MVRRRLIFALLSVVMVLWGGAFVAIRILVGHASALTVALLRFSLTTIGLLVVTSIVRPERRPIERADRGRVLLVALTGVAIYHLSLNYGEHFISASVAALIVASMPVMVALLSRLFLEEEIGPTKWAGIGVALSGVVVLVLWATPGVRLTVTNGFGAAVTALSPLAWAVYTVVGKPLVGKYGALRLTTIAMALGTLLLAPAALPSTIQDIGRLSMSDWAWLAFLAFGCSTFAYAVWFYSLTVLQPAELAVWVYFVPIAAAVWAALVLDERITAFIAIGGAMVLAGVIFTERVATRVAARHDAERVVA